MVTSTRFLIFTDMDGSLLDHYTYSFKPAKPLLLALEQHHIPVIPVSSKTKAELQHLQNELNNAHPFIIENGAAIYMPKQYFQHQPDETVEDDDFWVKAFVEPRETWQKLIAHVSEEFGNSFKTFEQIGIDGIIEMTQLDHDAAIRASQRQFGEPVVWYGTEHQKQKFIQALTDAGAHVLHGGRFMHVSGQCNKGLALKWLAQQYQSFDNSSSFITIAAGDSQNDQAMLEQADETVIIRSPVHEPPAITKQHNVYLSDAMGPEGWVEGITHILSSYHILKPTH